MNKDVELLKTENDSIIWLKIKGSRVASGKDVLVCLCYNIPNGSARKMFVTKNVFDIIADDMFHYQNEFINNCDFLVTGEFNARDRKELIM